MACSLHAVRLKLKFVPNSMRRFPAEPLSNVLFGNACTCDPAVQSGAQGCASSAGSPFLQRLQLQPCRAHGQPTGPHLHEILFLLSHSSTAVPLSATLQGPHMPAG